MLAQNGYTYNDAEMAFALAIAIGALNTTKGDTYYAGDWMYMHSELNGRVDAFKHIETRQYYRVPRD